MMLLDEGFKVVSVDASDKMLKHALKARWERRREQRYDEWGASFKQALISDLFNLVMSTRLGIYGITS